MPVKEWIQQQWETRTNVVYFGSLILLVSLAWLVGLAGKGTQVNQIQEKHGFAYAYHISTGSGVKIIPTELTRDKLLLVVRNASEDPPSPDGASWKLVVLPKPGTKEILIQPAIDRLPKDITPYAYATTVQAGNYKQTWTKDSLSVPALHIPVTAGATVINVSTGGNSAGKDQYGPSFPLYLEVR